MMFIVRDNICITKLYVKATLCLQTHDLSCVYVLVRFLKTVLR